MKVNQYAMQLRRANLRVLRPLGIAKWRLPVRRKQKQAAVEQRAEDEDRDGDHGM